MTRPLGFDHLQALLRQYTTGLPDVRKPNPNTRYTIQNAALGAFGIFVMQSPASVTRCRRTTRRTAQGVRPGVCNQTSSGASLARAGSSPSARMLARCRHNVACR